MWRARESVHYEHAVCVAVHAERLGASEDVCWHGPYATQLQVTLIPLTKEP